MNNMGYYDDVLEHHGILGQKWGVRRFQNADGTLTAKGKERREKNISKIDDSYDKFNDRIKKAKVKFDEKGEYSKSKIAEKMLSENELARTKLKKSLKEGDADYEKKMLKGDMAIVALGEVKLNNLSAASRYSRYSLDTQQKAILTNLKHAKVKDLDAVTVDVGLRYLEMVADARKKTAQYAGPAGIQRTTEAELYLQKNKKPTKTVHYVKL